MDPEKLALLAIGAGLGFLSAVGGAIAKHWLTLRLDRVREERKKAAEAGRKLPLKEAERLLQLDGRLSGYQVTIIGTITLESGAAADVGFEAEEKAEGAVRVGSPL